MRRVKKWPWQRITSIGSVIAITASLVTVAYLSPGLPVTEVDLNDSGVWVTNQQLAAVGRFNHSAQALDGAVYPAYTDFDVLQEDANVFVRDRLGGSYVSVNPTTLTTNSTVTLDPASQMGLGGGMVAILDPKMGDLWILPANSAASFVADAEVFTPAVTDVSSGAVITVGLDGTTYLLDPAAASITIIPADPAVNRIRTLKLDKLDPNGTFTLTVVGTTPVAYDHGARLLYLGDRSPISLDLTDKESDSLTLQQPSQSAPAVVYETTQGLVSQPLKGDAASLLPTQPDGIPSQPVQLNGCTYAVWSDSASFIRDCAGDNADLSTIVPNADPADELRLRTNRGNIVLNQMKNGAVWLVSDQLVEVDNWESVMAADTGEDDADQSSEEINQAQRPDRTQENNPPVAQDDNFGVRPGRSTLLPVLENDEDADGDLLTASLNSAPPSIGALGLVYSNSVFQIDVPDNATGSSTFLYTASDGRGGQSSAKVTVAIHPMTENNAPKVVRQTKLTVTAGKKVSYNVLTDWRDPDGDTIFLTAADPGSDEDSVQILADGSLTFQDGGKSTGVKAIKITVSDGQTTAEGTVQVTVLPAGNRPPVTVNDLVSGQVGTPIAVHPLLNDTDPDNNPINLTSVSNDPRCVIASDLTAGLVTATCSEPGTIYLTYTITDGPSPNQYGLIRLDVLPQATDDQPPIAVPDTILMHAGRTVTVPVLNNDVNPMGWPLVVTAASAPVGAPVQVAVINNEKVLVTPLRDFSTPLTLSYQISNGKGFSTSTITVVPVPSSSRVSSPVAHDDTVRVRVGDVATVSVLDNDNQPDGVPIKLLPDLLQSPDPDSEALVFTAGNDVRIHARQQPGTYLVLYQVAVTEGTAEPATGRLTIYVIKDDPDHNQAPKPADIQARTVANQPVTIWIPLDGIDPDGDSVSLIGIASAPDRGIVTAVKGNQIVYDPMGQVAGSVTFTYTVRDRKGLDGIGKVIVGIAPSASTNSPPVAVTDKIEVRPDRSVSPQVTLNDYDPDGDPISLVPDSVVSQAFTATTENNRVTFTAPSAEGDYSATYQIVDSYGQTTTGILTVSVRQDIPLQKPTPQDDFVSMTDTLANTTLKVDVLKNDDDPDGNISQDTLAVDNPNAIVSQGQIQVTLTPQPQIIDYTLTDPDNLVGRAFIFVPGTDTIPPQLKVDTKGFEVKAGESYSFDLGDYVLVRPEHSPRVTEAAKVTAWNGSATVDSTTWLTFQAPPDYQGPAAVSLEVTDGTSLDDPSGLRAVVTIPVTVLPGDEAPNQPPALAAATVTVEVGGQGTVNLTPFASDPDPDDKLVFAIAGQPELAGVTAELNGDTLTVNAERTVPKRSQTTVPVTVSDGHNPAVTAQVQVTVVASTRPLPQTVDDVVDAAHQGRTECLNVTANDVNPFPDTPLTVVSATVQAGAGSADPGCNGAGSVSVTPDDAFVGQMTVQYVVQDATQDTDRQVTGQIRLTVKGRPDAPTGLHIDQVGDKMVVLSWQPPNNNGEPITEYTVTGTPPYSKQCLGTICTLDGLTNNITYTFVVRATNAVGISDPSPASDEARPDAVPYVLDPPNVTFGDRQLSYTWVPKGSPGSPVTSYNLQISPAPADGASVRTGITGTSYVWTGLTNGTAYRVKVCPVNLAPEACLQDSYWSDYSLEEVPAAPPDAPAQPAVTRLQPVGDEAQAQVCWNKPATNGADITSYTLRVSNGTSVQVTPSGSTQTCRAMQLPTSTTDYSFTVAATNKAGLGAWSTTSAAFRSFVTPGAVSGLSADDGDGRCSVTFTAAATNGAKSSEVTYYYSTSNGRSGNFGTATSGTVTGLPNGTGSSNASYTISVWATATVQGQSYDGSKQSTTCTPYGKPFAPGLSMSASSDKSSGRVNYSWSDPGRNGRDYYVQINVDGSGWQTVSNSGSDGVDTGWSKPHSIQAKTCDSTGACSDIVSKNATANPEPPSPSVTVSRGDYWGACQVGGGSCYYIKVTTANFRGDVTCQVTSTDAGVDDRWKSWTQGPNDTKQPSGIAIGVNNGITVTCGGVPSAHNRI